MRLGRIQKDVLKFVLDCYPRGAYIYSRSSGLCGYDEPQVLRAIEGLVKRGILKYGKIKIVHLEGGYDCSLLKKKLQ